MTCDKKRGNTLPTNFETNLIIFYVFHYVIKVVKIKLKLNTKCQEGRHHLPPLPPSSSSRALEVTLLVSLPPHNTTGHCVTEVIFTSISLTCNTNSLSYSDMS